MCPMSDHKAVSIRMHTRQASKKPEKWMHNDAMLDDPTYVDTLQQEIAAYEVLHPCHEHAEGAAGWLDDLLMELRQTSITYATTKASEKRQRWKQLEGDLHAAEAIVSSHPPNACFLNNLNEVTFNL